MTLKGCNRVPKGLKIADAGVRADAGHLTGSEGAVSYAVIATRYGRRSIILESSPVIVSHWASRGSGERVGAGAGPIEAGAAQGERAEVGFDGFLALFLDVRRRRWIGTASHGSAR